MKSKQSQIIGGRHAVFHALKAGRRRVHALYLQKGLREQGIEALLAEAEGCGVPVETRDKSFFSGQVELETHQGVAALVDQVCFLSLDEVIDAAGQSGPRQRLLLIDGIEDPHNLGALLRSALCFGIQGVIWPRRRCAPLSATAVKSAAGAVEYLSLCHVNGLTQAMERLREVGYWIYGSLVHGGKVIWEETFPEKAALVIGGEARGLHRLVRERSDVLLSIPCQESLASLNASVAGGVLMSYFCLGAANKTGDLRNALNEMPTFIAHLHFYQKISRKKFSTRRLFDSFLDLHNVFRRNKNIGKVIIHVG